MLSVKCPLPPSQSYIFDPRPDLSLVTTVKRFIISQNSEGLTLVFTHGTAMHKESWEPTIHDLLKLVGREDIREVSKLVLFSIPLQRLTRQTE